MQRYVGIDFGTSNSAVAICGPSGPAELLELPDGSVMRSVLYFEPGGTVHAGGEAIARYLANESEGRLLQSIKSHLASGSFQATQIFGHRWKLPEIVGRFIRALREASPIDLGSRAVVGRPVRYWGSDSEDDDARAISRMEEALTLAGFEEVVFVPEPSAAALAYAARADGEQLAVIADFGGGTSDFSVLELAPGHPVEILANGGVGIGGDSFDAEIIDAAVAPILGKGGHYRDELGAPAPIPAWLYGNLRRWHLLSFLKVPRTEALLERLHRGADDPEAIERLQILVEEDLGLSLHESVEKAKIALSSNSRHILQLREPGVSFARPLTRDGFEDWIATELGRVGETIGEVMRLAGRRPEDVSRVFATGGSSLVPAVQRLLTRCFPKAEIVGGEALTSVATGLAYQARERFG